MSMTLLLVLTIRNTKSGLASGSFELRKWATNDSSLQQIIDLKEFQHEKTDCKRKVLGINWSTDKDEFIFQFDVLTLAETLAETLPPTKRNILKIGAKIFDPLGLISPINLQFSASCALLE